jgi:flavin reductase (DIM6/NTAB) family NADH-FMN oxidoreductase RutF
LTPELLKQVMRHQATTVVLITTDRDDRAGMTATSFTSVSVNPPLVLFCVARTAPAWLALSVTDRIGIHLLGEDSQELARRFSTTGIDRFDHPAIGYDDGLTPVAVAVAWLECRVADRIPAGDHHIILATPVRGGHVGRGQCRPLLYHDRRYTSVTEPKRERSPARYPAD